MIITDQIYIQEERLGVIIHRA